MAKDSKPTSILERKKDAEIEAVLNQMYGYFTREEAPRIVWSDTGLRRSA